MKLSQFIISIGKISIRVNTNNEEVLFSKYFSKKMIQKSSKGYDCEVFVIFTDNVYDFCCNEATGKSWRARRMEEGYYIAHYFGEKMKLVENDNKMYIIGKNSDLVFWRYGIKKILTVEAYKKRILHLKAGAISINEKAFLIISPGERGKTTFIKKMLEYEEIKYISNTHVIVDKDEVYGLDSNMRIRENKNEVYYPPYELFSENKIVSSGKICGILFVNGNNDELVIRQMSDEKAMYIIDYFADAIGVYNLKVDVMEYLGYDYEKFASYCINNRKLKKNLLSVGCYYVFGDILKENNADYVKEYVDNLK